MKNICTTTKYLPLLVLCIFFTTTLPVFAQEKATFTGSASCEPCHEEQYASFMKHSKKALSWKGIAKMLPKLTEQERQECYSCHTTGYGLTGGFVSYEKTPELADVGCETCHGPASLHIVSGDPAEIQRTPQTEQCFTCHNENRIENFNFKPLRYSGAH